MTQPNPPIPREDLTPLPIELEHPVAANLFGRIEQQRRELDRTDAVQIAEETRLRKEREAFLRVERLRRCIGYCLGGVAILLVITLMAVALRTLHALTPATTPFEERHNWLTGAVHVVVSGTGIFFAYQLIKAAERLILPSWWVERHPEAARLLMGVRDPFVASIKHAERALGLGERFLRAVTGAATSLKAPKS